MFLCTMSDKMAVVRFNNRNYHFEHTFASGWVPCTKGYQGTARNHPRGAWLELKRLHDPKIIV